MKRTAWSALVLIALSACSSGEVASQPSAATQGGSPAAAPSNDSVRISEEHVRESCGTWQDILDVATDSTNFFPENLEETLARYAEMYEDLAATANRSGNAALSEAAAAQRRFHVRSQRATAAGEQLAVEEWDTSRDAGDALIAECEAFGIPIRDSRMPREAIEGRSE